MKLFLLFFTPPSMMTCTLFDLENSITCDLRSFHSSSSLLYHILISGDCVFLCVTGKCSVLWFDLSDGSWPVCFIGVYKACVVSLNCLSLLFGHKAIHLHPNKQVFDYLVHHDVGFSKG